MTYRTFQRYNGFEFMEDLVNAMTVADPGRRPVIEEVITRFSQIRKSLGEFKLRSLITAKKDSTVVTAFRYTQQAVRTVQYIILQNPAIPKP